MDAPQSGVHGGGPRGLAAGRLLRRDRLPPRLPPPPARVALGQRQPGGAPPVALELVNDGFAAPVNPRPLVLVFDGPTRVDVPAVDFDLRTLQPGETQTVCVDAVLPADLPAGMYRIGLRLADPPEPRRRPAPGDPPRQRHRRRVGRRRQLVRGELHRRLITPV
ncbi:DUF4832 domain-containing protein [Nannocystis pusilla]|uniref:DUF4832 domain-containing protein n=1 Tax=Nannocystis pusilla TaxID=889268 RepID=UPI003B83834B